MNDTTVDSTASENEEIDPIMARLEALEMTVSQLRDENTELTHKVDTMSRLMLSQEKAFDLRARAAFRGNLESILHLMEHQDQYIAEASNMSGITGPNQDIKFTLTIVDGENVKENAESFYCTKLDDGTIGLSFTTAPDDYVSGRGDHIKAFLQTKPFLFEGSARRLFNYTEEKIKNG